MLLDRLVAIEPEAPRGGTNLSRRWLLRAGVAVGGGLLLEVALPWPTPPAAAAAADGFAPNAFVRIGRDGPSIVLRPRGTTSAPRLHLDGRGGCSDAGRRWRGIGHLDSLGCGRGAGPRSGRIRWHIDRHGDTTSCRFDAADGVDSVLRRAPRQVAETLLQAHPEATVIYAHNDEMAMGAIAALEAAGKVPGKDVMIISIDGTKDAINAILEGKMLATVECNPKFGPKAMDAVERYGKGEKIEPWVVNVDRFFDKDTAAAYLPEAY